MSGFSFTKPIEKVDFFAVLPTGAYILAVLGCYLHRLRFPPQEGSGTGGQSVVISLRGPSTVSPWRLKKAIAHTIAWWTYTIPLISIP